MSDVQSGPHLSASVTRSVVTRRRSAPIGSRFRNAPGGLAARTRGSLDVMNSFLAVRGSGHALLGLFLVLAACGSNTPGDDDDGAAGSGGTTGGTTGGTSPNAGKSGGGAGGSAGSTATTGGTGGTGGTAGQAASGGSGGSNVGGAGTGAAGATTGGTAGTAGTTGGTGGAANGGAGGTVAAGMGGDGGTAGDGVAGAAGMAGGSSAVWRCPAGVTGTPVLTGTPTRVTSVPPADDFNMNNNNFGNVEGPVWIGDALYVSEMSYMAYSQADGEVKKARILKVTADGQASIFVADSGSNGLAVDDDGNILGAVHKDGSITRFPLPSGTAVPVVSTFMSARFNSPNDLALRSDGTIYFSDPNFQAPTTKPQTQTRVYRVPPGGQAEPVPNATTPDMFGNPNGVTLSLTEDFLYVAASTGRRYPVMTDGSLGAGTDFAATNGGDGMAIDCAGNLYVAKSNSADVAVFTSSGTSIGTISVNDVQAVTNVAFGGADHQTLYITGLGNNKGLFKLQMNIPGRPY